MRCPICGSKMKYGVCGYCKITADQVENASNKEVAVARKDGRKKEVYYSTTAPKDINVMRLKLLTIFLGWCGVHNFYVKRNIKGLFSILSIFVALLFFAIKQIAPSNLGIVFQFFYELSFYIVGISLIMWVWDIVAVLCKSFKIPVILGKKANIGKYDTASKERILMEVTQEVLTEVDEIRKEEKQTKSNSKQTNKKK